MWPFAAVFVSLLCILTPSTHSQEFCTNPEGQPGTCINIRSCSALLNLLQTGSQNPAVNNFLRSSVCGYEGKDPRVCCPSDRGGGNADDTDTVAGDRGSKGVTKTAYGPLYPPECGSSNLTLRRIVGGEPATLGAWPWATVLGYRNRLNRNSPKWLCGGVLISKRHVLTAAHCVYQQNDLYKVRIGDLDLKNDYDGATPFEDFIERKTIHPRYDPKTITNDIAILKTTRDVPFSPTLHPVCLPVDEYNRYRNLDNSFPFVIGWGSIYFRGPASSQLLQTQMPVRTEQDCKQAFRNFKSTIIDNRVLCAGYTQGGKDSCQGDSGGPLMTPDPRTRKFYVVGVVSFGFKCAEPGFPGVYTKVTAFLDFITSQLV
ncbi:hypothetical protein DMN91_005410 [Ooceraea biroi]|uniref:CLIP domain-containing serine protease n=1 Tax=Ooceraea biroi TaxID=2015173 RepID=A0A026VUK8_OOCBI|nr:venom protease [Ooceraea biroi]EZA47437.1 Proclotting enzyme [Ooceraea biroi]RLU23132.1 hypothetical protein DMN91_005410 [Ooceraea biroi]